MSIHRRLAQSTRAGIVVAAVSATVMTVAGKVVAAEPGPIPVVAYDITETPVSGWGGWSHAYTGTIADTGRTTGPNCSAAGTQIASYSSGGGTLNDGVTDAANIDSTHLLCIDVASDGDLVRPEITVRFAGEVLVDRIVIHGGGTGGNIYPGAIEAATIGIGGAEANITSVPAGLPNDVGVLRDDVFDLTPTGLSSMPTTEVTISGIVTAFFGFPLGQAAIAEITVEGRVAALPVDLDIRPASSPNVIDLSSRLPVPLAILSSPSLDVRTIDLATLRFGHTGDEDSLLACIRVTDINRDRRPDLVCLAAIRRTGFVLGDVEGRISGHTTSGSQIAGRDDVIVRA